MHDDRPWHRLHNSSWWVFFISLAVYGLLNCSNLVLGVGYPNGWPFVDGGLPYRFPWILAIDFLIMTTVVVGSTFFVELRVRRGSFPSTFRTNIALVLAVIATVSIWLSTHREALEYAATIVELGGGTSVTTLRLQMVAQRAIFEFGQPAAYLFILLTFLTIFDLAGYVWSDSKSQTARRVFYFVLLLPLVIRALWILFQDALS